MRAPITECATVLRVRDIAHPHCNDNDGGQDRCASMSIVWSATSFSGEVGPCGRV